MNLLALVVLKADNQTTLSELAQNEDGIRAKAGYYGKLRVPLLLAGSCELTMEYTSSDDNTEVNFLIPGANKTHTVKFYNNQVSSFDGQLTPAKLPVGFRRKVSLVIRRGGQADTAELSIDYQKLPAWQGSFEKQQTDDRWSIGPTTALGIGLHRSSVTIHSLRLKMLDRQSRLLRVDESEAADDADGA